jgi:uncharacterized membrane protein YgdD (TMEM256/DUF423 family)
MKPNWTAVGAFSAAVAVLLGAAGAHMLQGRVSAGDLEMWKTGVLYQVIHALGLVLFGLFQDGLRRDGRASSSVPGWAFFLGSALFSGTLYAHVLGASEAMLHVAPIGGLTLIAGWVAFAVCALRIPRQLDGRA